MAYCSRIFVQAVILLALPGAIVPAVEADRQKISVQEARRLVCEVVKAHNPRAEVGRTQNPYDHEFLYFEVLAANPMASPVVGHYAVNPWTGDVWNPALCNIVTIPSLKKMQDRIRKRFKYTEEEYSRLRAKRPVCS